MTARDSVNEKTVPAATGTATATNTITQTGRDLMSIIHYLFGLYYLLRGDARSAPAPVPAVTIPDGLPEDDAAPELTVEQPPPPDLAPTPTRATTPDDYPTTVDVRPSLRGRGHTVTVERISEAHARSYYPGDLTPGALVMVERTDGRIGTVKAPPRGTPAVTAARIHASVYGATYVPRIEAAR
jgi:hypothetical protein